MPTRASVFRALLLCLFPLAAAAGRDIPDEYAWVGVHVSQYWPYHEEIATDFVEQATLGGAQLGYRLPLDLSLQIQGQREDARSGERGRRIKVEQGSLSVRQHFGDATVEPYAGISLGELVFTSAEPNDETMLGLEGGVQKRIQPHWIVDIGVRAPHSLDNERFDLQAWIGVNHIFPFNGGE